MQPRIPMFGKQCLVCGHFEEARKEDLFDCSKCHAFELHIWPSRRRRQPSEG
jgi:Zn finger protein HypA/HybF involved in hydrogenase expression